MKKFLTVLLALSVVFTYTVGTAFAAAPADAKDKLSSETMIKAIENAYKSAKDDLAKAKTDALYDIFKNAASKTLDDVTVSRSAVEAVYDATYYDKAVAQAKTEYEAMLQKVQVGIGKGADYFYVSDTDTTMQTDGTQKAYPINTTFTLMTASKSGTDASTKAAYAGLFKVNDQSEFDGSAKDEVAQEEATLAKDTAIKAIRAIDLSAYSKEYNGEAKSNYDLATDLVAAAIKAINDLAVSNTTGWNDVFGATTGIIAKVADVYTAPENQQKAGGKLYTGGLLASPYDKIGLNKLDTISDAPTAAAKMEWAKAKVLEALTTEINEWLSGNVDAQNKIILDETLAGTKGDAAKIAAAKTKIEEFKAGAAAATEVATYLVNNTKKLSDLITENATKFSESTILVGEGLPWYFGAGKLYADSYGIKDTAAYDVAKLVAISEHVADLKQDAENKKASVMIDGAEYVAIEKALEKAIDECYTKGTTTNKLEVGDATNALWDRIDSLINGTDVTVNNRKYNSVSKWYNEASYDKAYYDKARAEVKAATEAIEAAKTVEEADAAFLAGYEKFSAVPTKADKNAAQATKEFADLKAQYDKDIDAYVDYKVTSLTNAGLADKYSWTPATLKAALKEELAKAYTVDELKTKLAEAKAVVDGLKTQAELADAKKAIDARVAALPASVTVADKETVAALKNDLEDHNDYCDMIGNVAQKVIIKASVENAYKKIKVAEEDAIKEAIKAIGTVTVEDKAAIESVRKQLDAYVAYYAGENATTNEINELENVKYNGKSVADLEKALDKAEMNAFYVMVGKLAADGSDVAGIKAARAAFEAMSLDAKKQVYRSSEYDKLVDLEKLLIKNVESLKITASSKAVKGKITVKWNVKGVAAAADGYRVYKSTKAQSGYKFMGKTKKLYMDNKKGLKKGKRYFYKVRAYKVVDGKTYYSDYSNKANRFAK